MLRNLLLTPLAAALFVVPIVSSQNQSSTSTIQSSGASQSVFQTRAGTITVYLPSDMAAGDSISGTVVAEPAAAKDPAQQKKNSGELNGYVIELDQNRARAGDKQLHWKMPTTIAAGEILLVLKDSKGKVLGQTKVHVAAAPPAPGADFQIPHLAQAGRPIQISGPFDGNSANTNVTIGGSSVPILAESPRQAILQNPQSTPGSVPVVINEDGKMANGSFRNLQIDLTAAKTTLMRGEQTELRVEVNGLAGLTESVPVRLRNQTPEVVDVAGGNNQTIPLAPGAAPSQTFSRTLTGVSSGQFNIVADVVYLPATTSGTTPSTSPPKPAPAPAPPILPGPSAGNTGTTTPSATASGMPAPSPRAGTAPPNIPVTPGTVPAMPVATPTPKENPCCQKIRDENGGGKRLIWRQGNNSFELKGNNLLLEIDGVRAAWKFDRDLEREFCYSKQYEIASELKQVSETNLKDGKTNERQETTSLLFTGPDPDNQTTRPHKSFQFMASKLNNKAVKEYQVVLTVDEEKCTWMLSLFRDDQLKEYLNRPPREPMEILDEMLRNLRRTHSGEQTYKHGDWWTNMYRMLGEIQQWLAWLDGHPDQGQRDKINESYGAWRDNLKLALTNMQRHGTNVSPADKQTMSDLEKLLREDLPSREQLFEIHQKFNSLWEKFHDGGAKF